MPARGCGLPISTPRSCPAVTRSAGFRVEPSLSLANHSTPALRPPRSPAWKTSERAELTKPSSGTERSPDQRPPSTAQKTRGPRDSSTVPQLRPGPAEYLTRGRKESCIYYSARTRGSPSPLLLPRACLLPPPDSFFLFPAAAKSRRFRVGAARGQRTPILIPHAPPASPPPHVPRLPSTPLSIPLLRIFPSAPFLLLAPRRGASSSLRFFLITRSSLLHPSRGRDTPLRQSPNPIPNNSSQLLPVLLSFRSPERNRFCGGEFSRRIRRVGSVVKDRVFSAGFSYRNTEMSALLDLLMGIFRQQTLGGAALELAALAAPLWLAALVGLLIGWAWRPRWAGVVVGDDNAQQQAAAQLPAPPPPARPTATATAVVSRNEAAAVVPRTVVAPAAAPEDERLAVNTGDLMHLWRLVEEKDGGPSWIHMMDRTLPTMRYQAWRRDPPNGPPQYRSSTIFEDASPEVVRDFFWDDEFRIKNSWDDMLLQHGTLEECTKTGTLVVRWVRKFPFFCSDREYIIGRRIWASGKTFYCVTKGVPRPSVPRQNKPRRVDLYYSSWCIRPVESRKGDGSMTACEVLLFHHEDMGIPWEIAKLGVRQGMWGCVKRIEPGLRAYQVARTAGEPISKCAAMSHVTTRFNADELITEENTEASSSNNAAEVEKPKHWTNNIPKVLMIGGAVALACTFDGGLLTKAVIFGTARRFAGPGRR